MNFG
jgi:hypothetical protein